MIASPCIGSCGLDPDWQLCAGCARSGAEIAAWKDADSASRARTWADLPRRRAALGIGLHRLNWAPGDILDFAAATLQAGSGVWAVALGRFEVGDESAAIDRRNPLIATSARSAIRFTITDRVRALAVPIAGDPGGERIVLAVPQGRATPATTPGLIPLGPDADAIRPADRDGRLYDLGLGPTSTTRTCLRTADSGLAAELDRRVGWPWGAVRAALAGRLAEHPPAWVAANPVARIEVVGSADPPALPDRGMPAGVEVPEAFLACATFDPAGARRPAFVSCSSDFTAPVTR